jgi:hypothetical protein
MAKVLICLAILASIFLTQCQGSEEARRHRMNNRHSELLKPESNAIDHGPIHPGGHKSESHLLGHRGEQQWGVKKQRKMKNKIKSHHSLGGHDGLDDLRLQDLTHRDALEKPRTTKKTNDDLKVNNSHEALKKTSHKKRFMKKLKLWKAKMLQAKKSKNHSGSRKKTSSSKKIYPMP